MDNEDEFNEELFLEDYNSEPHQRTSYHDLWWKENEHYYADLEYQQVDFSGSIKGQTCILRFRKELYDEELVEKGENESTFELWFNGKDEVIKFLEKITKELKEYSTVTEEFRKNNQKKVKISKE